MPGPPGPSPYSCCRDPASHYRALGGDTSIESTLTLRAPRSQRHPAHRPLLSRIRGSAEEGELGPLPCLSSLTVTVSSTSAPSQQTAISVFPLHCHHPGLCDDNLPWPCAPQICFPSGPSSYTHSHACLDVYLSHVCIDQRIAVLFSHVVLSPAVPFITV